LTLPWNQNQSEERFVEPKIMEENKVVIHSEKKGFQSDHAGEIVNHVINSVEFKFQLRNGAECTGSYDGFEMNSHRVADGRIKFAVDLQAAQIHIKESKMNAQFHSTEFLSTAKFPLVHFESTALIRDNAGQLTLFGLLSLRNVIREIAIQVVSVNLVFDQNQRLFERVHFRSWIDRRLWGLQSTAENAEGQTISFQVLLEGKFHRRIINAN
jgi:polyisoprenoid-binding protein YceI